VGAVTAGVAAVVELVAALAVATVAAAAMVADEAFEPPSAAARRLRVVLTANHLATDAWATVALAKMMVQMVEGRPQGQEDSSALDDCGCRRLLLLLHHHHHHHHHQQELQMMTALVSFLKFAAGWQSLGHQTQLV
jgi:hypothetical protein